MTGKANRFGLLAVAFLLCVAGSGGTHSRRSILVTKSERYRVHNIHAFAKVPKPDYGGFVHSGRPIAPDFTVQYGYVAHPELASDSFGASA
jgi:hypothetical protein